MTMRPTVSEFSWEGPVSGQGRRSDDVRRANLGLLLRLVHLTGPQSRSSLASAMGVNRSTIAGLVAELVELGLVEETAPNTAQQVGRPSPIVQPRSSVVSLAMNPETDAVTVGLVDFTGQVIRRIRYETEQVPTPVEAVRIAAAVIEGMRGELDDKFLVTGIGVAVPGLVRASDGLVRWAPHLGWVDENIAAELADATGYPALAGNDASLGAIAEHRFGAARGVDSLIFLNGGASGIGGGIVHEGRLFGGVEGYAGEWGHATVPTARGVAGQLEEIVNQSILLTELGLTPKEVDRLEAELIRATSAGLPDFVRVQIHALGASIRNAVNVLNPQLVVLGGFLASLQRADEQLLLTLVAEESLRASFDAVTIVPSQLGEDRLLVGAAELVFDSVMNDPARVVGEIRATRHRPVTAAG